MPRQLTIEISPDLVTELLTTGHQLEHSVITRGLPEGAKFSDVGLSQLGNIVMVFEISGEGDHLTEAVQITSIRDIGT